jgi:NADPH:quinone reductase-like Zn-dependent oxidoreductase
VKPNGVDLAQITKLVEEGKVKPIVKTTLPLKMIERAHKIAESSTSIGAVSIQVSEEPPRKFFIQNQPNISKQ